MRRLISFVIAMLVAAAAGAQPAIPGPEEFLGAPLGARFNSWGRLLDYYAELARRSPLLTLHPIGESYEGRPLVTLVLTSEKNRSRLDAIRSDVASLAKGKVDAARGAEIAKTTPAVVWLGFGVHGNESSSAEAAVRVVTSLLNDAAVRTLLDDLVVVIDPLQNPDGRERYIQWYGRTRGMRANANPDSFEHSEPWPGGRFNHYMIDMNRDWAWTSQRETAARVAEYQRWNPQVFVDFHEMSATASYFFPPAAKPLNAQLPRDLEKWLDTFGRANAADFSAKGWPFFVGETFDLFYPGYGDSWPSLRGAIGMTYEVAGGGRGGTAFRRDDGTTLTLAHRIDQHATSALATLRTAASNREALLRYTYDAARSQIASGKNTYLVQPDSPNFEALISLLQRQGISVGRLTAPVTARATPVNGSAAESRTFAAGTAVVTTGQPQGRLAETLMEKLPTFSPGFLEEQRKRADADEPDDFYDLTAWSLPLAMNVQAHVTTAPLTGVESWIRSETPAFRPAAFGYLVDGHDPNVYRFAGELLSAGVHFSVADQEVTLGDRRHARGSVIVLKSNNSAAIDDAVRTAAARAQATVDGVQTGWSGGTPLGSERIRYVRDPKIAIVGGPGVGATSFGMMWHTLDVDTPIPHSTISVDSLRNLDLSRYRVLVLPDGDVYADRLGKAGIERLQAWLRAGGTVVAVRDAAKFLRAKETEISKLRLWEPPKKKDDAPATDERYHDFRVPGSAFRTTMNERSFLTFGMPRPPAVLVEGSAAFVPASHKVDNILTIDVKEPLLAGVAWPESLERLKGSPVLVDEPFGRGHVITFANEPYYRSFWRGTLPAFLNAVLYAPSFPR